MIVGARDPLSLGGQLAKDAEKRYPGWNVNTAGLMGEDLHLDVTDHVQWQQVMELHPWHWVVCTAGINLETDLTGQNPLWSVDQQYHVNFVGHMMGLSAWLDTWHDGEVWDDREAYLPKGTRLQWVSISSNSAQVARSKSLGYCASKAALSMGIRCAGRAMADDGFSIYGYEPGWVDDTPMSREVWDRMITSVVMPEGLSYIPAAHRIPGNNTLAGEDLAALINNNLALEMTALNGTLLRVDGGEQ